MMTTTSTPTVTVDLPPSFYDDHVGRDLPAGTELKRTKRYVRVEMDRATYEEMLSDARHYSEPDPSWTIKHDAYLLGISRSAQAAVARLEKVGPPEEPVQEQTTVKEGGDMENAVPAVKKLATKKWIVEGHEDRRFTSKRAAQQFAQELEPVEPVQAEPVEEAPEPEQAPEVRYDVVMNSSGTPVLGNAPVDSVAWFLAQRLAQSKVSKPLRSFKVQDRTLKPDAEHDADYLSEPVEAEIFAMEHVTKEMVADAKSELAQASKEPKGKGKKVLKTLTEGRPSKPTKQARVPEVGERFADEQVVTGTGGKVTYGMVRRIREETEQFFVPGGPRGKVAAYHRLAKELGLGMETVAKISRRNIFADVE